MRKATTPTTTYLTALIALWLCLSTAFLPAVSANKNTKLDRKWKQRKAKCQSTLCYHLIPEESANCINECTSAACYEEVFVRMPLEDGEIDDNRSRAFTNCLRKEQKEFNKKDMRNNGADYDV
jgi:hypothetical protein